jgi:hypothetical protein
MVRCSWQKQRPVVGLGEVQHGASLLFQHVRVQALGAELRNAMLECGAFGGQLGEDGLAFAELARMLQPRDQPAIALHGVIGEINADRRAENLRQQCAQAFAKIKSTEHVGTESQMIPRRQQLFEFGTQLLCNDFSAVDVVHADLGPALMPVLLPQAFAISFTPANACGCWFDLYCEQIDEAERCN